jgi:hypothetical protein
MASTKAVGVTQLKARLPEYDRRLLDAAIGA